MSELKHQPCKKEYYAFFKKRRTVRNHCYGYSKLFCYGIKDYATEDVIPECRNCDEWEMNVDNWIDKIVKVEKGEK